MNGRPGEAAISRAAALLAQMERRLAESDEVPVAA